MATLTPLAPGDIDARATFLAQVQDERLRFQISTLGMYPYDLPSLFPRTAGWGVRREVKRRVKLLRHCEERFGHLLYPDEVVRFVTTGTLSSFAEQYFMGLFALIINRTIFVMTNYRVILLNARGDKPRQMQWQIPYNQVRHFKSGGFISSSITFKLEDGKRHNFSGVPSGDRKQLRMFFEQIRQAPSFDFPHHVSRDPLCPACSTPVPPRTRQCPTCKEAFIDPKVPAILSACFPCLGDFYLGHWIMGSLEVVGYVVVALMLMGWLNNEGADAVPMVIGVLLVEHGYDALLTHHVAKKGVQLKRFAWQRH